MINQQYYFKPEIRKIDPSVDLPKDSCYATCFPVNSYLWSINKGHIKKKDGTAVTIDECRLFDSPDIDKLKDLLENRVILHPCGNIAYESYTNFIFIESVRIAYSSNDYPANATLNYRRITEKMTVDYGSLFSINDLTLIEGKLLHVWEDKNQRYPIELKYLDKESSHQLSNWIERKELFENNNQYTLF